MSSLLSLLPPDFFLQERCYCHFPPAIVFMCVVVKPCISDEMGRSQVILEPLRVNQLSLTTDTFSRLYMNNALNIKI